MLQHDAAREVVPDPLAAARLVPLGRLRELLDEARGGPAAREELRQHVDGHDEVVAQVHEDEHRAGRDLARHGEPRAREEDAELQERPAEVLAHRADQALPPVASALEALDLGIGCVEEPARLGLRAEGLDHGEAREQVAQPGDEALVAGRDCPFALPHLAPHGHGHRERCRAERHGRRRERHREREHHSERPREQKRVIDDEEAALEVALLDGGDVVGEQREVAARVLAGEGAHALLREALERERLVLRERAIDERALGTIHPEAHGERCQQKGAAEHGQARELGDVTGADDVDDAAKKPRPHERGGHVEHREHERGGKVETVVTIECANVVARGGSHGRLHGLLPSGGTDMSRGT